MMRRGIKIRILTLDVTGTIFDFKEAPAKVYKRFASDSGLEVSYEVLQDSLAMNMKRMSKEHLHFGASGIGSYNWWNHVIHQTFQGSIDYVS